MGHGIVHILGPRDPYRILAVADSSFFKHDALTTFLHCDLCTEREILQTVLVFLGSRLFRCVLPAGCTPLNRPFVIACGKQIQNGDRALTFTRPHGFIHVLVTKVVVFAAVYARQAYASENVGFLSGSASLTSTIPRRARHCGFQNAAFVPGFFIVPCVQIVALCFAVDVALSSASTTDCEFN